MPDREVASDLRCLEALDIAGHAAKVRGSHRLLLSSAAEAEVDIRLRLPHRRTMSGIEAAERACAPYRLDRRNSAIERQRRELCRPQDHARCRCQHHRCRSVGLAQHGRSDPHDRAGLGQACGPSHAVSSTLAAVLVAGSSGRPWARKAGLSARRQPMTQDTDTQPSAQARAGLGDLRGLILTGGQSARALRCSASSALLWRYQDNRVAGRVLKHSPGLWTPKMLLRMPRATP
jgi:hypothetical protein